MSSIFIYSLRLEGPTHRPKASVFDDVGMRHTFKLGTFGRIEVTVRICVIIFTPSPAASFSPLHISKNAKHVGANIYVLLVFLQSIIYL